MPSPTRWKREIAGIAFRRWAAATRLTQFNLARFLALSEPTIRRLERGASPTPEVLDRLIDLEVVDSIDCAPNMALARQLRELDGHLPRTRT